MYNLLTYFATSPEWFHDNRAGWNWLITPIKFGEPAPLLAISNGNQHFDILATLSLFCMYLLLITGGIKLLTRPKKLKITGIICIALGIRLGIIVHQHGTPFLETKLINLFLLFECIMIGFAWIGTVWILQARRKRLSKHSSIVPNHML